MKNHDEIIEAFLLFSGPSSRTEICTVTGIKRTPVHDALMRLSLKGSVYCETVPCGIGRPTTYWSIDELV